MFSFSIDMFLGRETIVTHIKDIGPIVGAVIAILTYVTKSYFDISSRKKEAAIACADELIEFYNDEATWIATRLLDYGYINERSDKFIKCHSINIDRKTLYSALDIHRLANKKNEFETPYTQAEVEVRNIFDRFLTRLERIDSLIEAGVIPKRQFGKYFNYWFELTGKSHPGDKIIHGKHRSKIYWDYILTYNYNSVIYLYKKFDRLPYEVEAKFFKKQWLDYKSATAES